MSASLDPIRAISTEELPPCAVVPESTHAAIVEHAAAQNARSGRRWSLPEWGAITASLVIGVLVSRIVWDRDADLFVVQQGRMTVQGDLDAALSRQTGNAIDRKTGIKVGVSYVAKSGDYCRAFTISKEHVLAGLACRRNSQWTIDALTRATANSSDAYRMAGVEVPALILSIVENSISGEPLDAEQEAEARGKDWQR
jgi:hypothetical protein